MKLTQFIHRAQEALDRGEFHVVEAACRHVLATYPTCLSAHRLLGEACLEQGRIEEAVERFGLTLVLDPLDVVSYLGLGVAAEERGDLAAAHGHYLRAWELNPSLERLRDELVRLHGALPGSGRLQRSRAGLASLYARTGQLGRAVTEWRAVVVAEPANVPARTALVEVLWRQGDDGAALALCREVLAEAPETARVLAILADFEQRRALPGASTTAATYRSLDPAGDILTALLAIKPQANLAWLLPEPAMVPPFDFGAALRVGAPVHTLVEAGPPSVAVPEAPSAVPSSSGQLGPAPDLWDTLVRDLGSGGGEAGDLAPFSWPTEDPHGGLEPDDDLAGVARFGTTSLGDTRFDESFVEAAGGLEAAVAPNPAAEDALAAFVGATPAALPAHGPDRFVTADGRIDLTVGWDELDRTLADATPTGNVDGFDELIAAVGAEGLAPFDPLAGDSEAWEPFGAEDFGDWEHTPEPAPAGDKWAPAAALPEPPRTVDESARPGGADQDLLWFDDAMPAAVDAAPPQPAPALNGEALADAAGSAIVPEQHTLADLDAVQALTLGWDAIEEELAAALPPVDPLAVVDGLESIDDEGLVPFDFSGAADAVDPLASPDAVGAPLDFDDLLLVTSRDATGPLGGGSAPEATGWGSQDGQDVGGRALPPDEAGFAWDDETAQAQPGQVSGALAEIEPFAFDEPATAWADDAIDFSDVEGLPAPSVGDGDDFALCDEPPVAAQAAPRRAEGAAVDWAVDPWSPERAQAEEALESVSDEAIAIVADRPEVGIAAAVAAAAVADPVALAGLEGEAAAFVRFAGDDIAAPMVADFDAVRSSAWPAFVGGTSELVDRSGEAGTIFARLRAEKTSLMDLGMLQTDRSLAPPPADAGGEAGAVPLGPDGYATGREEGDRTRSAAVSPAMRDEVARWRARWRLDPAAAEGVAAEIERRIAADGPEPLYLRVLGETYVKLGRLDLAATRFRAATMGRLRRP